MDARARSESDQFAGSLRTGLAQRTPPAPCRPVRVTRSSAEFLQLERILQRLHRQFHVFPIDRHRDLDLRGGDDLDVDALFACWKTIVSLEKPWRLQSYTFV